MKHIAIIPVRGGSKGIPRKNARLLNGRPLMSYIIQAAHDANCFDVIAVSTDDEELAHIAQTLNTPVIMRPTHLADDQTALDKVIHHAVETLEQETGMYMDTVTTLQATSPLLTPATIQRAVHQFRRGGQDTIVSVCDDTHLAWNLQNGKPVPAYRKRLNRQFLPPHFRETGGIVVCKRSVLKTGSRFGKSIGIIQCDKKESIDIDDRFDWWIAEKQLQRKKIIFRVEGYAEIGLGHIYRSLTLADNMMDHDIEFILSRRSQPGIRLIKSRHYPLKTFTGHPSHELDAITSCHPDIIINDQLNTSRAYMRALKSLGCRIINFEDQGPGHKLADLVINAMYPPTSNDAQILSGPDYVCLRDEFYRTRPISIQPDVRRILLVFGGSDPCNLTLKVLTWLSNHNNIPGIIAIIGPGYRHQTKLNIFKKKHPDINLHIVQNTKVITKYMEQSDLAITSAGRTVFELASLGIPMMVYSQNAREARHVFLQNEPGLINMGHGARASLRLFKKNLDRLMHSQTIRQAMHSSLLSNHFKDGVTNVWSRILK